MVVVQIGQTRKGLGSFQAVLAVLGRAKEQRTAPAAAGAIAGKARVVSGFVQLENDIERS